MRLRSAGGPNRQKPASLAMCADAPHYQTLIKATRERKRECGLSSVKTPLSAFLPPAPPNPHPHNLVYNPFPSLALFFPFPVTTFTVLGVWFFSCAIFFLPASLHCLHFSLYSLLLSLSRALFRFIFLPSVSLPPSHPPFILSRCCAAAPRGSQRWEMY